MRFCSYLKNKGLYASINQFKLLFSIKGNIYQE